MIPKNVDGWINDYEVVLNAFENICDVSTSDKVQIIGHNYIKEVRVYIIVEPNTLYYRVCKTDYMLENYKKELLQYLEKKAFD